MTRFDAYAGAVSVPVTTGLALVEPALGLAVGFALFATVNVALRAVRLPRVRLQRRLRVESG
jgi:hypothetical protein